MLCSDLMPCCAMRGKIRQFSYLFSNFCDFIGFSINFEQFWDPSGFSGLHVSIFCLNTYLAMCFWSICFRFQQKRETWKVLKTLRLCIDLRVRLFEQSARSSEKMCCFCSSIFHWKSIENQAPKLEKQFPRQTSMKHRFLASLLAPRIVF